MGTHLPTFAIVVDVILPVLDEAEALPVVLAGLPAGFRPLVVDNGSSDGSAEIADRLGAEVVVEPRPGFGWACHTGLRAARSDVVCFMDADASFSGSDLGRVASPVLEDRADLVLGRRVAERDAWPIHARLANRALAGGLRRWCGVMLTDLGPIRAVRREPLLALGTRDRRFGWPLEMVMRAAAAGWRIDEVPVRYSPRIGRSKVTGTLAGSLRATRDMAAVARSLR
jgi:glycosyltransferase involved in cell wall biosynthesis